MRARALADPGVREVGAGGEPGAHRAPLAAPERVHLDLGPAVAGMAAGHEVEAAQELAGRDHDRRAPGPRTTARPSSAPRASSAAARPAQPVGRRAEHEHVARPASPSPSASSVERQRGRRRRRRRRPAEADRAGEVARRRRAGSGRARPGAPATAAASAGVARRRPRGRAATTAGSPTARRAGSRCRARRGAGR